ncbi:CRISPR-associated protein Cmr5 [Natranaerovirga hydrolytica]|uniref:CRISPR type III-B/RAMP module-associated protein Cmr5 n=1 Tax=Natranaerovirga hydrolytica TaxID=680378 RepID=A0A4R1N152_9FIRM|nr:type III-B CRISPR module-associated protein Cmr5 [Natranaerovirga hydrolytica]TCK98670.1 CRISPR-associated protein Cmr5 [Natranaerovirga hydrolytica]
MKETSLIVDMNREKALTAYNNITMYRKYVEETYNEEWKRKEEYKKMKSCCRRLPVLIKNNGLINAMGFIKSKSSFSAVDGVQGDSEENSNPNKLNVYSYIYSWIIDGLVNSKLFDDVSEEVKIEEKVLMADNKTYQLCIKEILEWTIWYKKHVEVMLEKES